MIAASGLLQDLRKLLGTLEDDLRERCREQAEVDATVHAEYDQARQAGRTAHAYEIWREGHLTQVGAAWILACVFVRFLEDNGLVDTPHLAGPGPRLALARDHHTDYFSRHPTETDREYLLFVFRETARLPALGTLLGERHNPLFALGLSADGARSLLGFWRRLDPTTGEILHDFTDPGWNTRFLGDLYQDLSEAARKTYALLQTPVFVEEFILDHTLEPAIQEFGYEVVRLIDPACGSGHFLLGAFRRLVDRWLRDEPGTNTRALAQRALDAIHGVDLNPFAVAIARFRLLLAALQACAVTRMADAPDFHINLAVGDSLLHGPRVGGYRGRQEILSPGEDPIRHVYETEDADELRRILGQSYHAVVGNPPYITPKDPALNEAYRERFGSCYRQYSLAVPFTERCFDLALAPEPGTSTPAGFVGMITANSFMKREFGKKLIEEFIPRWDLTHVIDTSGAYIPGHGTPTLILFARHRRPVEKTIRTVMGIRGEPQTPEDPAKGIVWSAILAQLDQPGSQSEFVSVADVPRERFHTHPWSIGGGGAADLKELLDESTGSRLEKHCEEIGFGAVTREDDAYLVSRSVVLRHRISPEHCRPLVAGEEIRDWAIHEPNEAIWPYDPWTLDALPAAAVVRFLWPWRRQLSMRVAYGLTQIERGLQWYEYSMFFRERFRTPLSIAFAFVATHNHFVLDRGGKVFNRSAPVIKLPVRATEEDHLRLLGLLNSSTACFWMKQVFYPKATSTGDISVEKGRPEANRYEFAVTGLLSFPVPEKAAGAEAEIARLLDQAAGEMSLLEPGRLVARWSDAHASLESLAASLQAGEVATEKVRKRMISLQEELDWECYRQYGLCDEGANEEVIADSAIGVDPPARPAFWMTDEAPASLSPGLKELYKRRRSLLRFVPEVAMIETSVFKRLWLGQQGVFGHTSATYREKSKDALRGWLLNRLEDARYWREPRLTSCAQLADRLHQDVEFMRVAELYHGQPDFDLTRLVSELAEAEAVPFLPVLRYAASGILKRAAWEQTWEFQRREDSIDARTSLPSGGPEHLTEEQAKVLRAKEIGDIPVPPKYSAADFQQQGYWRLRGKLDIPKERFILYPFAQREGDPTPVIGWAGWDALEQGRALASYALEMRETEGWSADRLAPLLTGLVELLPWLRQWHNEVDPAYGIGMGDYFAQFLDEEARTLGLTVDALRAWGPQKAVAKRGKKAK